jgi:hypothetical protein
MCRARVVTCFAHHLDNAHPLACRPNFRDISHNDSFPQTRVRILEIRIQPLIKSVIDQYHLGPAPLERMLSQENVRGMRVAVDESGLKYLGVKDRRNELGHLPGSRRGKVYL